MARVNTFIVGSWSSGVLSACGIDALAVALQRGAIAQGSGEGWFYYKDYVAKSATPRHNVARFGHKIGLRLKGG